MFGTLSRPLPKKQISRLLLVDAAVILVLLLIPVRSGWNSYRNARNLLKAQVELRDSFVLRLGAAISAERNKPILLGEIRAATAVLSEGAQRLRAPAEISAILEDLRDLARGAGLSRIGINPGEIMRQTGFQDQGMILTAYGRYRNLLRFLHGLRNHRTFLIVEGLGLRVDEEHSSRPVLRLELNLRTFLVEDIMPLNQIVEMVADTTGIFNGPGNEVLPPQSEPNLDSGEAVR